MAEIDEALKRDVSIGAYRRGLVQFGNFTLHSGGWSPYYLDVRPVPSFVDENALITDMSRREQIDFRNTVVRVYGLLLDQIRYHHIMAVPEALTHFVGMVGHDRGDSVISRRVKPKSHGSSRTGILGQYEHGESVGFVDDLVTSAQSLVEEKAHVEDVSRYNDFDVTTGEGLHVTGAAVLLDREQGGIENAQKADLLVVAGMTVTEFINIPHDEGIMVDEAFAIINGYMQGKIKSAADISSRWGTLRLPATPNELWGPNRLWDKVGS